MISLTWEIKVEAHHKSTAASLYSTQELPIIVVKYLKKRLDYNIGLAGNKNNFCYSGLLLFRAKAPYHAPKKER